MLEGIVRESIGKKASKALKRDGYLLANIYAKGVENIYAAFKTNYFIKELRAKTTLPFDIKVGAKKYKVVVVDYQKDPITSNLRHVDLKIVLDNVVSKYLIPIKIIGVPIGLKNKGVMVTYKRRIAVKCDAKHLPNIFEIDVSKLDVDDNILIRDIEIPKGVVMLENPNISIVGVTLAN